MGTGRRGGCAGLQSGPGNGPEAAPGAGQGRAPRPSDSRWNDGGEHGSGSVEKAEIRTRNDRLAKHRPGLGFTPDAREEVDSRAPFPGRWPAPDEEPEGPVEAILFRERLGTDPLGNGPAGLDDEWIVAEKQRLHGDGARLAAPSGGVDVGEIEGLKEGGAAVAECGRVDAAANVVEHVAILDRLGGSVVGIDLPCPRDREPTERAIKPPRRRKQTVADLLGIEPTPQRPAPQPTISFGGGGHRLPVGAAEDNLPDERLEPRALFRKPAREPVEELRVGGALAAGPDNSLRPLEPAGMARSVAKTSGNPRGTTRPRFFSTPRTRIAASPGVGWSSTTIAVGRGSSSALSRPSSASISTRRAVAAPGGESVISCFTVVRSTFSRATRASISARREAISAGSGSGRAIHRATLSVSLKSVLVLAKMPASP